MIWFSSKPSWTIVFSPQLSYKSISLGTEKGFSTTSKKVAFSCNLSVVKDSYNVEYAQFPGFYFSVCPRFPVHIAGCQHRILAVRVLSISGTRAERPGPSRAAQPSSSTGRRRGPGCVRGSAGAGGGEKGRGRPCAGRDRTEDCRDREGFPGLPRTTRKTDAPVDSPLLRVPFRRRDSEAVNGRTKDPYWVVWQ